MLIEIRKLNIINNGYTRKVSLDKVYINPANVVTIKDYSAAKDFLLQEAGPDYSEKQFSLIRICLGQKVEEIIALGTAEDIYNTFHKTDRTLLNG